MTSLAVDHTPKLVGMSAMANCAGLDGVEDGDLVRVLTERGRIFVRVYDEIQPAAVLMVSDDAWRKVRVAFAERPERVEIRALTWWERWTRKLTAKHAAAVLALVTTLFAGIIGLAPVIAPGDNAALSAVRTQLSNAAAWPTSKVLSDQDVAGLRRADSEARQVAPAPDQIPSWVKVTGGIVLILSAFATALIALRAADS